MRRICDTWTRGLGAGFLAGTLDGLLIFVSDSGATAAVMAQSVLAWTLMGWVVFATESCLRPIWHGIIVTVLLNLPWFIQFAVINGHPEHLIPLIGMSVTFGLAFGWAKQQFGEGVRRG